MKKIRMMTTAALVSAAMLSTGLAAGAASAERLTGEARLAKVLEGRTIGKPQDCINQRDIQGTEIIDKTAIVYTMNGGRVFVNRARDSASILRRDDILVTRSFNDRLCSIDIVQLVDRGSRFPRGSIGLGEFETYSKRAKAVKP